MGLGVKRRKIGDIIIDGDAVYIAAKEEIAEYIAENLSKIAEFNVKPQIADAGEAERLKRADEFSEINASVNSLRLDCVIAVITRLSREKSKEFINSGRVGVNHLETTDASKQLKENDVISVKGLGRFVLSQINGATKKGRLRVVVKKFV
jgi:RNA-binding protein YlmH